MEVFIPRLSPPRLALVAAAQTLCSTVDALVRYVRCLSVAVVAGFMTLTGTRRYTPARMTTTIIKMRNLPNSVRMCLLGIVETKLLGTVYSMHLPISLILRTATFLSTTKQLLSERSHYNNILMTKSQGGIM